MDVDDVVDGETGEKELTDAQKEKLFRRCFNVAYYWLGRSDQSAFFIEEKLRKKEIPQDIIDRAMSRLHEDGYLNDQSYAEKYTQMRSSSDHRGKNAIRYELRRKGVDNELIEQSLSQIEPEDEEAQARELLERKIRSTKGLDRPKRISRMVGLLSRRGYSPGLAYSLVKEMLDEEDTEEDSDHNYGEDGF